VDSRIRQLELRIAAEEAVANTESDATEFARRVLERADRLLEERAPGRILVLRELTTRWRMLHAGLHLAGEEEAVAAELAEWLDDRAQVALAGSGARHAADDDLAVFADEVEWRARYWAERSDGERPFWGVALEDEGPLPDALLRARPAVVAGVVARLARLGSIARAVRMLSSAAADALSRRLEYGDDVRASYERAPRAPAVQSRAVEELPGWVLRALDGIRPGDDGPHVTVVVTALLVALRAEGHEAAESDHAELVAEAKERATRTGRPEDRQRADAADAAAARPAPDAPTAPKLQHTGFGGLFYLVRLLVELRCAEFLFTACLPEREVLAAAMRELLCGDGDDDPAPETIGGVERATATDVAVEQMREVTGALLGALVEAIPRRGLATFPAMHLSRVDAELLVATPSGAPWVAFAWPGATRMDVEEGIARFLRVWPHAAPPITSAPALAELDRTGRVRPTHKLAALPWLTGAPQVAWRAVVSQIGGAAAMLLTLRASISTQSPETFRDRYLAVRGTIASSSDELVVTLPMERIDLAIRRAGLDRDPGWVPWLKRAVSIEFADL
jgi:hypothetical protein